MGEVKGWMGKVWVRDEGMLRMCSEVECGGLG